MNRLILIALVLLISIVGLWAHAGHAHGPTPGEEEGSGSALTTLELSSAALQNLGIQSEEAVLGPLQKKLILPSRIEALPEKNAQITARFEGTIIEPLVKLGEAVKKDQPLLKLDPTLIGNPPVIYRSPLEGYVTQFNLNKGSHFSPGDVLMQVSDYTQVLVRGTSYENAELTNIKIGQSARIIMDMAPGEILSGPVQRLDVGLESENRTFEVFALLDNPNFKLRPNQQATLTLGVGEASDVLSVPTRAILGETGNLFIFVQDGNFFERRSVVLGIKAGDRTEILEGVFPGENVVIQGNYQLQYAKPMSLGKSKAGHGEEEGTPHTHEKPWWFWTLIGLASLGSLGLFFGFFRHFYIGKDLK